MLAELDAKLAAAREEFETVASNRATDEKIRAEIVNLLTQWFIHGKPDSHQKDLAPSGEEDLTVGPAARTSD